MAATGNARPYFGEAFYKAVEKKNVATGKVGCFPLRKLKNRSLSVIASASSTPGSIDTINGKKINIGINGGDHQAPFWGNKNSESAKESGVDAPFHAVLLGRFVEDRFVYRQTFIIRSYEIGPDKTATMETLMNLLQVGS
jgi:fatty acyl-ACP thioesterase B